MMFTFTFLYVANIIMRCVSCLSQTLQKQGLPSDQPNGVPSVPLPGANDQLLSRAILRRWLNTQELDPDESRLVADFQVECGTPEHDLLQYVSMAMVVLYPIGVPACVFFMLYWNRAELRKEDSHKREQFEPLVGAYKLECWYWEVCGQYFSLKTLSRFLISALWFLRRLKCSAKSS